MAGITKVLGPINHNFGVAFDVSSSLSNILICNQGTEDITVQITIGIDGGAGFLIRNTVIPQGVTLQLLENQPLKLKSGKASIKYTCASQDDELMTVTYTSQ